MNSIINLYNNLDEKTRSSFTSSLNSRTSVSRKINSSNYDDTWLTKMEETIRYLDNILRNPNRFIVNEEEIVKIELAKRITVDSIKHLSRNTNFIQKYDPETNEVKPSKILNINKEESFNTYENRFIYTLINNMKMYIERKKSEVVSGTFKKEHREISYFGNTSVNKEKIEISLQIKSDLNDNTSKGSNIQDRIKKVEDRITDLCSTGVYKDIARLHVSPVVSPIKKTNLILKNVNFQYALDLWNYMQSHMDASSKRENKNNHYEDNGYLKQMMNDSFLIDYLIMKSIDNESEMQKEELKNKVATNTVNQLLSINDNLSVEDVLKLIGDEYIKVKYKKVSNTELIEKKYKEAIDFYIAKDHELRIKNEEDTGK